MMNRLLKPLILIISLLSLQACKKDEPVHPEIRTSGPVALSPARVLFKGEIIKRGSFKVIDHGFIYGPAQSIGDTFGTKVSLGTEATDGTISKEVSVTSNNYDRILYVRAYLTNENGTAYGAVMSVQMPSILLGSIVPSQGKIGDQVVINGNFSSLTKDEVKVVFGGMQATISGITSSAVTVQVPQGIGTSFYNNQVLVTVTVAGTSNNVSQLFRVLPRFKDFSPKSGTVGTRVLITGDNLSYYINNVKVFLGQTQVGAYVESNGVSVIIPSSVTEDKFSISIENDGVRTNLPGEFSVLAPTITSISPTSGLPGGTFSIFGGTFVNTYPNNLKIFVGASEANYIYQSSGQLQVTIPSNLTPGEYMVTIKAGPHTVEALQKITITQLNITGFSPTSGSVGKEVTIQGSFIAGLSYQVNFGSGVAFSTSSSSTSIKANVPSVQSGTVKITVKYGNQSVISTGDFTVLGPSITSFSPQSGVAGTEVTITGSGFGTYLYSNSVKFGTVSAPVLSVSESSIRVLVPSNLTPGGMKISVTNSSGQTVVSSSNFNVTN